jgi:sulfur carrier protein
MITVYLNNHPLSVSINTSLQEALYIGSQLNQNLEVINVAAVVNQNIVPKSEWQHYHCQPNDQIELFAAVAGG